MLFSTARKKRGFEGILRPPGITLRVTPKRLQRLDKQTLWTLRLPNQMTSPHWQATRMLRRQFYFPIPRILPNLRVIAHPPHQLKTTIRQKKKTTVSEKIAVFEKTFLQAVKERGPARTKLTHQVDGDRFYTICSFYLQNLLGNLQDAHPRKVSRNNVNDKEKEKWQTLKGTLKQDAFARLITVCEDLCRDQPELF